MGVVELWPRGVSPVLPMPGIPGGLIPAPPPNTPGGGGGILKGAVMVGGGWPRLMMLSGLIPNGMVGGSPLGVAGANPRPALGGGMVGVCGM